MATVSIHQSLRMMLVVFGWACLSVSFSTTAYGGSELDPSDELAAKIDRHISEGWRQNQAEAAPLADDPEFLRRTYLNIAGRIPSVNEVLEFLDSSLPDKRRELVEQLLESPGYSSNFAHIWRDIILPEASTTANPFNQFGDVDQFDTWLRDRLGRDSRFDRMAREVISGRLEIPSEGSTTAYSRLKDGKPENLAAGTARAFLGVRLECAQCHNHPFAKWQREDFWKFAAFYGGSLQDQSGNIISSGSGSGKIKIPDTDKEVTAAFLELAESPDFAKATPRAALADWVTAKENRYFARATVNRMWAHFFGIGLVDPADDFDENNPPSHPELLEDLANAFLAQNCDLRFLVRAITRSQAYQLTSRRTHASHENPRLFAKMLVKGLTSDQLFDSLLWATGNNELARDQQNFIYNNNNQRQQFRELFGQQVSAPGEVQTSILQALLMLNGNFVDQASSPANSMTLSALIEAPFFNNSERLETLYFAALARPPRPDEVAILLKYVEEKTPDRDWKQAIGDVYWVLLNSSEFLLNH